MFGIADVDLLDRMVSAVARSSTASSAYDGSAGGCRRGSTPSSAATPSPPGSPAWTRPAVRNTQDVDILLRRADLPAANDRSGRQVGFTYRRARGVDMFLMETTATGPQCCSCHVRQAKKSAPHESSCLPPTSASVGTGLQFFRVISHWRRLSADQTERPIAPWIKVHLRDMLDVGLVDETWKASLPAGTCGAAATAD